MDKKYYWILYQISDMEDKDNNVLMELVCDIHPLKYMGIRRDANMRKSKRFTLLNYKEISEEDYIEYRKRIGLDTSI